MKHGFLALLLSYAFDVPIVLLSAYLPQSPLWAGIAFAGGLLVGFLNYLLAYWVLGRFTKLGLVPADTTDLTAEVYQMEDYRDRS